MESNDFIEGDRIYDLYTGVYKPQIIRVALELDVFSPLEPGSANAEYIAHQCGCDISGMNCLLNYLASIKILEKQNDKFSLSPEAGTFLVRGRKSYVGDLVVDFVGSAPWESLRESIRSGQPKNIDLEIHFAEDAWIESYRNQRVPSSLDMWAKIGINVENPLKVRIIDLACGCAIKSMVLARKSPQVEITCLDTPRVLEAARDLAWRWGITSQVNFMAGNLLTIELGKACYDVCLLGQITHYLTAEQNYDLFRRIYKALVPAGKLVLDVPMETADLIDASRFLSLLLWANSGGRAYSFEEYRSWLLDIGYKVVEQLSERLLSAEK